ncbi:UNVERIFIED_CONTAM: hypothetical protein Slati_3843000 [Sesamum latifolium]|uniref:Uncharacterized protein n=1 Tax=Sesamum latifolium TaxID=2727402 RepID=A0AAW2TKJ5_9LAMI
MYDFSVESIRKNGGLAILWDKNVEVQLQNFSRNHIDVSIRLDEKHDWWRFTGFYDEPETSKMEASWNLLLALRTQSRRPWLCTADFSEILNQSEKAGGPPRPLWQMQNFSSSDQLPLLIALSQQPRLVGNRVRLFIFEDA